MSTTEPPTEPSDKTTRARRRVRATRTLELLGVLLVTVAYPTLLELHPRSADPPTAADMLLSMPLDAGLAVLLSALLMRGPGHPLRPREEWKRWRSQLALAVSLMFGIWIVDTMFWIVMRRIGLPDYPTPWAAAFKDPVVARLFPITMLVGVLYEEVLFRAYLLTRLTASMGSAPALLLSALCFAAVHTSYSPAARMSVFLFGLLYGVSWLGTRSLTALVCAHWGHDMLVTLMERP
jgi:membrane protease YdiL (CAAX protease family)